MNGACQVIGAGCGATNYQKQVHVDERLSKHKAAVLVAVKKMHQVFLAVESCQRSILVIEHRLMDFLSCVHDKGSIARNWFIQLWSC